MFQIQTASDQELFERYLAVCNEALMINKGRFPFRQILDGLGQHTPDRNSVQVLIVDDQPSEGFCIRYDKACQAVFASPVVNIVPQTKWKVTKSYLASVVGNPYEYINNPAKIDWEWLHSLHVRSGE